MNLRLAFLAPLLALPRLAVAQDVPEPPVAIDVECISAYATQVRVDGLQVDWEAESQPVDRVQQLVEGAYRYDYTGPNDASFRLWCRYTHNGLYFAVVGRDDALVAPERRNDGDRLRFTIDLDPGADATEMATFEVPLWPALGDGLSTVTWLSGGEGELPAARAEIATRDNGWFAEISVPWIALPGLSEPFAPLPFSAAHIDWDHDVDGEEECIIGTSPLSGAVSGRMVPDGVDRRLREVRRALAIEDDAFAPQFADVAGDERAEWIGILGDHLVVAGLSLGGNATWLATGVRTTTDHEPISITTHDLDHDGDGEILYRWGRTITPLDGGTPVRQEFVTAWDVSAEGITRLFAQEVLNERDGAFRLAMDMDLRERSDHTTVRFRLVDGATTSRHDYLDIDGEDRVDYELMLLPWAGPDRIDWEPSADGTWAVVPL